MKLIVICAWCGKFIRFKDSPGDTPPKDPISHGICPECKRKLEDETEEILGEKQEHIFKRRGGRHEPKCQTGIE